MMGVVRLLYVTGNYRDMTVKHNEPNLTGPKSQETPLYEGLLF